MFIDGGRGVLSVRLGKKFDGSDARRLKEALATLGSFARLTVDFSDVMESDDAALADLANDAARFPQGKVTLRGMTFHQSRVLRYLGGKCEQVA
jgi:hypothetical protein